MLHHSREDERASCLTRLAVFCKHSTPSIPAVSTSFYPNQMHMMLSKYIYHQLPATCFGVCYTIFNETI